MMADEMKVIVTWETSKWYFQCVLTFLNMITDLSGHQRPPKPTWDAWLEQCHVLSGRKLEQFSFKSRREIRIWGTLSSWFPGEWTCCFFSHKIPSHKNSISVVVSVYLLGTQFWNNSGPETLRLADIRYNFVRFSETVLWLVNRHDLATGHRRVIVELWRKIDRVWWFFFSVVVSW